MAYPQAEEYIPKFLLFLQEKDVIKNYRIKKQEAREIYINEFISKYDVKKFSFSSMNSYLKYFKIIRHDKQTDTLIFKAEILNNITANTNIARRKSFKIAPALKAEQPSKVEAKLNIDEVTHNGSVESSQLEPSGSKISKPKPAKMKPPNQDKKKVDIKECKICSVHYANVQLLKEHQKTEQHNLRMDYVAKLKNKTSPVQGIYAEVESGYGGEMENVIVQRNELREIVLQLLNKTSDNYTVLNIVKVVKINDPTFLVNLEQNLPCILAANSQLCFKLRIFVAHNIFQQYPLLFKLKHAKSGKQIDIWKELVLGPVVLDGRLTGELYLKFLENYVTDLLDDVPLEIRQDMYFKHDGAPAHYCYLNIHVYSPIVKDLGPTQPYEKSSKPVLWDSYNEIVPGEHPEKKDTDFKPEFPLKKYSLPDNYTVVLNANLKEFTGMTVQQRNILKDIKFLLTDYEQKGTLQKHNYFKILQLSLMMEEHQMKIDIRKYDVDEQVLTAPAGFKSNCLELRVPGLAEHRPSVLRGDSVFIKDNKQSNIKYEGIVHKVNVDNVILGFSRRFINEVHIKKKKYSVSFTFNRVTLRAEHQAIELARSHNVIPLLCSEKIKTRQLKDHHVSWYNPHIENNVKQQQAIRCILSETSRPMPYLIFGPPGTGKTVTIVEAVLQIYKIKPKANLLVCAPSNSAANEITKRLVKHAQQRDLFRYVAPSYSYDQINTEIKPYTNYRDDYYHPPITQLTTYRIVVTTLVTASRLVNAGIHVDHFSYVFIDESGQATESETLIPIAGILTSPKKLGSINGQIVLAGDPKQLGPIIHSYKADKLGFGVSMLERLMTSNPLYQKDKKGQYNDAIVTKLVKSYRSHPAILNLPNRLFYDYELEAAGDRDLTYVAVNWKELPNPNFPVIFDSVIGKDQQEGNSPSFFNLQEVDVVVTYLEKLIGNRLSGMKVTEEHIGIITPYRKQVHKLKQACAKKQWTKLTIGSVEQFQGQERLIIIVSTVRAKPEFMKYDEKFHLGFLKNPKRFNVAITRAKALLVVVGNPKILQYDEHWRKFMEYCKDNKSFIGTPFEFTALHSNLLLNSLSTDNFMVNGDVNAEDGPSFSRGNM